jgi:hypothetical protein
VKPRPVFAGIALFLIASLPLAAAEASAAASDFRADMRKLWEDHVTWTRVYIISAAADLGDQKVAADRLLRNQVDLGDAIKPFYGEAAGAKLTTLLEEHITIATELIAAAKAGEDAKKDAAAARWRRNADDISSFLSAANPEHWPLADMKKMMHEHLDLTTEEVTARLTKNWAADVAAYDKVHSAILAMADMLSAGIIAQHPKEF